MELRVLGPVEVWTDGRRLPIVGAARRALLAVLLLDANRAVGTDVLVEVLWDGSPPRTATSSLQVMVHRLREALGTDQGRLVTTPSGYLFRAEAGELDLEVFERLAASGRAALAGRRFAEASARLREALAVWHGPALGGIRSAGLLRVEAPRLEELRLAALEERIEADLGLGRHGELVAELEGLVGTHPLRERLTGQLMLALYRSGRQGDALAVYRQARRRLAEELGLNPGTALRELERGILLADPALEPPAPAGAANGDPGAMKAAAAPTPAGPVPRQLPPDVVGFTGRDKELAELTGLLVRAAEERAEAQAVEAVGPAVVVIAGAAGIGKTALAVRAAHELRGRFPDGQLYVTLHGATAGLAPLEPLEVLGRLLRSLGISPAAIPHDLEEASGLLRSQVAGKRLLVVLDNARNAAQVRPLLPASPTCAVLVTSRRLLSTLDAACHMQLDVLAPAEAVELLARRAGPDRVAAVPETAAEVGRLCGHLPLAVRIAGARLAARPSWPLQTMADRLADAQRRLDELELGDIGVRASFAVSVQELAGSADPLDQAAARAFGLLGVLDGADIGVPVAARLLDAPEERTERMLERLVDAHLLETPAPGRYQFHDLVRLYAREHATDTRPEEERTAALSRAFGHYTATAWQTFALLRPRHQRLATADPTWTRDGRRFAGATEALGWLEAERGNLLAAIAQTADLAPAVPAKPALELAHALLGFFEVRNHWADQAQANRTALELAHQTGDMLGQAHAHNDLGRVEERLGRYPEALDHHQRALALYRELGDRHGQGTSLSNLGIVYDWLGRSPEALDHMRQALALRQEVDDRHGQAVSLSNLGAFYERLGRYPEALDHLERALAIKRELGDRHGQAASLSNLGLVHHRLGRYPEALDHLQQALTLCRELGDRHGEATTLSNLGLVYQRLGRYPEALDHQQQALVLFREVGNRHGQVESLRDLGDALLGAGRREQARAAWREALAICEALRIPESDEIRERLFLNR